MKREINPTAKSIAPQTLTDDEILGGLVAVTGEAPFFKNGHLQKEQCWCGGCCCCGFGFCCLLLSHKKDRLFINRSPLCFHALLATPIASSSSYVVIIISTVNFTWNSPFSHSIALITLTINSAVCTATKTSPFSLSDCFPLPLSLSPFLFFLYWNI